MRGALDGLVRDERGRELLRGVLRATVCTLCCRALLHITESSHQLVDSDEMAPNASAVDRGRMRRRKMRSDLRETPMRRADEVNRLDIDIPGHASPPKKRRVARGLGVDDLRFDEKPWWKREDSNLRSCTQAIYSRRPLPLGSRFLQAPELIRFLHTCPYGADTKRTRREVGPGTNRRSPRSK